MIHRNIICIDLKSFFASCECIERHLDPFKVPLVVTNPKQGNGAMTLAITPFLKAQGVKSRGRLYEIPKNIKYTIVPPRMSLYIEKSSAVVGVYLDYFSKDDIHVYSIDECFIDVTNYLKLYKKNDYELAQMLLNEVYKRTGLTATCGIGPNMLLAKIAMDTEAKKYKNGIAKWTYDDIPDKLWTITPLSKVWGIGPRMELRLNNLGIKSIGDLAHYDLNKLKHLFGIMGEELYNHANGIDDSIISDWKVPPKEHSISHSQILFKDYNGNNIRLIMDEMIDVTLRRLRKSNKEALCVGFGIGYSKSIGGGFYHNMKLDVPTDEHKVVLDICNIIFDRYYDNSPIRKVTISLGSLRDKTSTQLNIFEDISTKELEDNYNNTIDNIKDKFGKNSILKASSLLSDSTIKERNKKIGGHSE